MKDMKLSIEKYNTRIHSMNPGELKLLIKDIYDERKHNRNMSEESLKKLKNLEKKAEKRLKELNVLNDNTKKDFDDWKKQMKSGKRCY